ncbi:hypothetical protein [Streptomyces sp. MCL20-2]|uniref:hypothetical protein n=1 Tax=Streptomyces sp. MCL20-2 TaxID=2967219 RepID=UPI0029670E69|nr:hypothetical protein [Streptomyces sp. MCL20-2]
MADATVRWKCPCGASTEHRCPISWAPVTRPEQTGFPTVQGNCPACHRESLFLGSSGYVTCARLECPEPDAASTLLERRTTEGAR